MLRDLFLCQLYLRMRAEQLSDEIRKMMAPKLAKEFFGTSSGIFIGTEGYPKLNAGPLGLLDVQFAPPIMLKMDYGKIIAAQASVIRSNKKQNIFSRERFVSDMQEISLAKLPTDIEMIFSKKPSFAMSFDKIHQPMGASAKLESLRLTENPKIDNKVEKVVNDEMLANESSMVLYNHGIDVYKITTILSSGALGVKKKLVPTRWSITATDDIIAKSLLHDVRGFSSVNDFSVFESFNLDNRFVALVMPGSWEFENFEAWSAPVWKPGLEVEYEPFSGRTTYAEMEGGGYYASRIAVVEYLHKIKRQARVVVFREIYEGYSVPVGVWQVRENMRNAMTSSPVKFSSLKEAMNYVSTRLRFPLKNYMEKSTIFMQRRLTDF